MNESVTEVTPEAITEAATGRLHVISFTAGGYYVAGNEPGGKGERVLTIFRSASDAQEWIVHKNVRAEPFVVAADGQRLCGICQLALSENVNWYRINPPTFDGFEAYPLREFTARLRRAG